MDKRAIQKHLDELFPDKQVCRPLKESPNCLPYAVVDNAGSHFFVKAVSLVRSRREGLDEVEGLKRVDSEHVIKLLDWHKVDEDTALLIFPEVNGSTINAIKAEWKNENLRQLALEMGQAIQDMWGQKVVHRDLKPKNIMLDKGTAHFMLLDLGIGYFVDKYESKKAKSRGAQNYRSPEQIESILGDDIAISFASDHFSLGAILYELATGKHPFLGLPKDQYATVDHAICQHMLLPVREVNPDIDEQLGAIIDKLLSKEQSSRFASPEELIHALKGEEYAGPSANGQKLFLHAGQEYESFAEFTADNKSTGNVPDGIVLPATVAKKTINRFKALGYEILINPLTYCLPYPNASNTAIKKRYEIAEKKIIDQSTLQSDDFIEDLAYQVVLNQQDADYVVAPCFVVENVQEAGGEGQITANIKSWKAARVVFDETGSTKPFLGGIVVSTSILRNEKATKRLLDRLWGVYDVDGYYVILENETPGSGPTYDLELLKGYKIFLEALAKKGLVVVDRADLTVFGLLPKGIVSISPEQARRRFSIDKKLQNPEEINGTLSEEKIHVRYFSDALFDFIESREVLGLLSRLGFKSNIECDCSYCGKLEPLTRSKHQTKDHTLANQHFLLSISKDHKSIRDKKPADVREHYKKKYSAAKVLGDTIAGKLGAATRKRLGQYESIMSIIDK